MCSFCGPQIVPPTEKAAKYVLLLKGLIIIQFLIAIVDLVAVRSFLREGIFGLFFIVLLFGAFYKLSYHAILVYTFISIFFSVVFLVYILTIIQRGYTMSDLQGPWAQYYLAAACISFIFYLANAIFCFFPYREFKSIEYLDNPVFSEMMINSDAERNPEEMADQVKEVKYTVDYGNNQPEKEKKGKGSFQVFKGQGVRIG